MHESGTIIPNYNAHIGTRPTVCFTTVWHAQPVANPLYNYVSLCSTKSIVWNVGRSSCAEINILLGIPCLLQFLLEQIVVGCWHAHDVILMWDIIDDLWLS